MCHKYDKNNRIHADKTVNFSMTSKAKTTNTEELPKWVEIGCVGKAMPL